MPNNDYNPYAGCHKYEQLMEENKALKEQNESLHIIATEGARKGIEKSKEIAKLKQEMKELKEKFDDKEHWGYTMVAYIDDSDEWCHFDDWFREKIDEDDKKQKWVKEWMENTAYEDSDEEE